MTGTSPLDRDSTVLVPDPMDALSDVLKSVRLEGAFYINAEFAAPWCLRGECNVPAVRRRLVGAEHVLFFHFVIEGVCRAALLESGEEIEARAGDLILVTRDDAHLLGSDLQIPPMPTDRLIVADPNAEDGFVRLHHPGGGELTRFVCGYLACNRALCRPLLDTLPRLFRIPVGDATAVASLRELLRLGVRESTQSRPGTDSMLAKLSELMFVEAIRRYADNIPADSQGWMAGVRDPHIGRALGLIHAEPGRAWTVDDLAHAVAMSRSALAERFAALVGEAPIQYLTRWRLALAAKDLRAGSVPIIRIAERYGYTSEASFGRAFKREFDIPPAAWRRRGASRGADSPEPSAAVDVRQVPPAGLTRI